MIHVGFGEADITPKPGSQAPGGMQARVLNEVKDRLKAVAMVIRGEPEARLGQAMRWATAADLRSLELPPADAALIDGLAGK